MLLGSSETVSGLHNDASDALIAYRWAHIADGRRYLTNLRRLFPSSPAIGLASSLGRIVPFDETSPIRLIPAPQMPDDFGPEQDRPPKHIERCVQAAIGEPGMNGGVIIRPEGTAVFFKGGGKNLYNQRASIAANETVFGDAVILESYLQERPHLWYRLRPELLLSRKSPISSDVVSARAQTDTLHLKVAQSNRSCM